ncbi:unnamed protein product [Meloidogyne enterolobii]|uniref:Uncharacterized protein n=1 Tax=Meloidogyne enterolobii TaxID=390850 RepID=A0ACB0YWA9_MELEN
MFLQIFLLFIFVNPSILASPTVEQCDVVMKSENRYIPAECKCYQDFASCLFSNIIYGKCTKETMASKNYFDRPCKDIYSQCSLKKNECEINVCGCFKYLIFDFIFKKKFRTMVDCILQNKCKPVTNSAKLADLPTTNKHIRASNAVGFNEFFGKFLADESATDLRNE